MWFPFACSESAFGCMVLDWFGRRWNPISIPFVPARGSDESWLAFAIPIKSSGGRITSAALVPRPPRLHLHLNSMGDESVQRGPNVAGTLERQKWGKEIQSGPLDVGATPSQLVVTPTRKLAEPLTMLEGRISPTTNVVSSMPASMPPKMVVFEFNEVAESIAALFGSLVK